MALIAVMALAPAAVAQAACASGQDSCSGQWGVSGATFTAGGQYSCDGSGTFCAQQAAGQNASGLTCDSSPGGYCAQAGFNTSQPYIELDIGTSSVDVGTLRDNETHVGTATFSVKSYLAQGYQVTTSSPGPKNGSYTMQLMSSGAGSAGTEGFGMNLKQNSCPGAAPSSGAGSCTGNLGANPSQDPDSTFSFGYASTGYDTANSYKYNDGDTIAQSDSSSGFTDYTISYIFNITGATPGGTYTMAQSLVATSTF
jgi:hypothetical protein